MAELTGALEQAQMGNGRLVLLAGEAGIGKTRTAQELASVAERTGTLVLWGRCNEEQGVPAYWPWVQCIRSYIHRKELEELRTEMGAGAADISEIVPEVRDKLPDLEPSPLLEPDPARFRLFGSIAYFLKNAAQSQRLMVVLDDLHWADRSSLSLLQFLVRELADCRLLIVGCYRDVDLDRQHALSDTLAQLTREPTFQRSPLQGLSLDHTQEFIQAVAGISSTPTLAAAIYEHTEGNPFFMTEVIRLLGDQGELNSDEIGAPGGLPIPAGVRHVIGQRLNRLSEGCNQALTTASIIGREFDFKLLNTVEGNDSEDQPLKAIDEALSSHLIEESPGALDRYNFSHALIQQALAEGLSSSRRVRLHARIGETLEEMYDTEIDSHAAELAHHFTQAEPVLGSARLVHYALLAGEQALGSYAYEEAMDHFQRALDAKEGAPGDGETAAALFGLGRAQAAARQRPEAVANLVRAFEAYSELGEVAHAVEVGAYPITPGMGRVRVTPLIERALALVPPDSHEAGRVLARHGLALSSEMGYHLGAFNAFERAFAIAQRDGDLNLETPTLVTAAQIELFHVRWRESLEYGLRAIELARKTGDLLSEAYAHVYAWSVESSLGALKSAEEHASSALALAEKIRDRTLLTNALWSYAVISVGFCDWQAAREFSDRGLALAPRDPRLLGTRAMLEYETGNFELGGNYLQRLLEVMRSTSPGPTLEYATPAVTFPVVWRISGLAQHLDIAETAAKAVLSSPSSTPMLALWARLGLGLVLAQRGEVGEVEAHYADLLPQKGTHSPPVSVDHVLGLLAAVIGPLDLAESHFEDTLAAYRAPNRPYINVAWTCFDYASTLLARNAPGDRSKVEALLAEALSVSGEVGLIPLTERVAALQARIEAQPPRTPAFPDGLTQREVDVLRLVAAGKTDREIAEELVISFRTVTTHVSNILNKISAANRAEAAAYATRQGLS